MECPNCKADLNNIDIEGMFCKFCFYKFPEETLKKNPNEYIEELDLIFKDILYVSPSTVMKLSNPRNPLGKPLKIDTRW